MATPEQLNAVVCEHGRLQRRCDECAIHELEERVSELEAERQQHIAELTRLRAMTSPRTMTSDSPFDKLKRWAKPKGRCVQLVRGGGYQWGDGWNLTLSDGFSGKCVHVDEEDRTVIVDGDLVVMTPDEMIVEALEQWEASDE